MINRIIDFSVNNKFVVIAALAAACLAGVWSIQNMSLDAIPDLSDTQVIIFSRWDRSPDIVEDQVTYPIVTAMLGAPKVKAVRGLLGLRLFLRLHHLRGRDRHLLGPLADPGVPLSRALRSSPRASRPSWAPTPRAWAGSIQYALVDESGKLRPGRAPVVPGLVSPLPPQVRAGRRRGRARRRLRQAVPGQPRPEPSPGLRHLDRAR